MVEIIFNGKNSAIPTYDADKVRMSGALDRPAFLDSPVGPPPSLTQRALDLGSSMGGVIGLTGQVPSAGPVGTLMGMGAAGLEANRQQDRLTDLGINPGQRGNNISGLEAGVNSIGTTPWVTFPSWLGGKPGEKRRFNLFGSKNKVIPGLGIADSARQQARNIQENAYDGFDYDNNLGVQETRQSPAYTGVPTATSIVNSMYGSGQPSNLDSMAVSDQAAAQAAADRDYAGVDEMGFTADSDTGGGDDSGGDDGTVICTELHRQGKLCDEWFKVDKKVGLWFARNDPDVMTGYHFWGKPLARLMKKSSFISYVVSLLALPWAKEMYIQQGNNEISTFRGKFLHKFGLPICRIIGKAINSGKVHYVKSN